MDQKEDQGEKNDQNVKKPVRNAVDLQKLKLDKLFKNIERPVHLPEPQKKRGFSAAPEFVRNVMGSSAGAGSGEFHVYRHIRRRENARVKYIAEEADKEDKNLAYQRKLEENRILSEQRTAKKRAKRQKKRARQQGREKRPKVAAPAAAEQDSDDSSDSDGDDGEPGSGPEVEPGAEPGSGSTEGERVPGPRAESGPCDGTGAAAAAVSDPADSEAGTGPEGDGRTDTADSAAGTDEVEAARRLSSDNSASQVK